MAKEPQLKRGTRFGPWTLQSNEGVGGNGEVWRATNEEGEAVALKVLTRVKESDPEPYLRFKHETEVIRDVAPTGIAVLPIIGDPHLPDKPHKKDKPYFAMPLASRLDVAIKGASLHEKVEAIRQLAEALAQLLAQHGINHRDVKPANLYCYEGRYVLGDFGLATNPAAEVPVTEEGALPGPWWFLPSEVLTKPLSSIDWEKVDVYCLAMSLWCLITEKENPPRRLDKNGPDALTEHLNVPPRPIGLDAPAEDHAAAERRTHVRELDGILVDATAPYPQDRPALARFAQQLNDWAEGIRIRDGIQQAIAQAEDDEERVLRWLVMWARTDVTLGRKLFDVSEDDAPSPVEGLSNIEFSEALDGLRNGGWTLGEPQLAQRREPWGWSKVYPSIQGVRRIELGRVTRDVLPILRHLLLEGAMDSLTIDGDADCTVGTITLSGAEMYYLLHYLQQSGQITYGQQFMAGNRVFLSGIKLQPHGRQALADAQAS
jgi:serine/threonine protein kinase